jgi:hypothetical protein
VQGAEPFDVVSRLQNLPGVAWLAVGFPVESMGEIGKSAGKLAKNYLHEREKFSVEGEGTAGTTGADVAGAATSGILDGVKGAKVSLDAPKVRFRAAFDGSRGVVGVQVREGPGGTPTGRVPVDCFVSGGRHSSVLAWMAALAGYRLHLVHAKASDDSLLGIARLYSELSHRMDPRWLNLMVLSGDLVPPILKRYATRSKRLIFGGFRSVGNEQPSHLRSRAYSPLYLLPEEKFAAEFAALGLKEDGATTDWSARGAGGYKVSRFGGVTADVSDVLDGLA